MGGAAGSREGGRGHVLAAAGGGGGLRLLIAPPARVAGRSRRAWRGFGRGAWLLGGCDHACENYQKPAGRQEDRSATCLEPAVPSGGQGMAARPGSEPGQALDFPRALHSVPGCGSHGPAHLLGRNVGASLPGWGWNPNMATHRVHLPLGGRLGTSGQPQAGLNCPSAPVLRSPAAAPGPGSKSGLTQAGGRGEKGGVSKTCLTLWLPALVHTLWPVSWRGWLGEGEDSVSQHLEPGSLGEARRVGTRSLALPWPGGSCKSKILLWGGERRGHAGWGTWPSGLSLPRPSAEAPRGQAGVRPPSVEGWASRSLLGRQGGCGSGGRWAARLRCEHCLVSKATVLAFAWRGRCRAAWRGSDADWATPPCSSGSVLVLLLVGFVLLVDAVGRA